MLPKFKMRRVSFLSLSIILELNDFEVIYLKIGLERQGFFCIILFYSFQDLNVLRRIVFVIDSDTFGKKTRDIAELLYDVLVAVRSASVPLLIACNKQDLDMAKSSKAIKSLLEKELGLVCKTRNATLESTSDSQKNVILAKNGDFKWETHGKNVEFIDLTATEDGSFETLKSWTT